MAAAAATETPAIPSALPHERRTQPACAAEGALVTGTRRPRQYQCAHAQTGTERNHEPGMEQVVPLRPAGRGDGKRQRHDGEQADDDRPARAGVARGTSVDAVRHCFL